ncbi:hypothetical protein SMICM304S_00765 [Streptomyces microflavus]
MTADDGQFVLPGMGLAAAHRDLPGVQRARLTHLGGRVGTPGDLAVADPALGAGGHLRADVHLARRHVRQQVLGGVQERPHHGDRPRRVLPHQGAAHGDHRLDAQPRQPADRVAHGERRPYRLQRCRRPVVAQPEQGSRQIPQRTDDGALMGLDDLREGGGRLVQRHIQLLRHPGPATGPGPDAHQQHAHITPAAEHRSAARLRGGRVRGARCGGSLGGGPLRLLPGDGEQGRRRGRGHRRPPGGRRTGGRRAVEQPHRGRYLLHRRGQLLVVVEDAPLERLEVPGRLKSVLLDQRPAYAAEHVQGLGLPPAAVQGQHQLPAQPLAQRLRLRERVELPEHRVVPPAGEFGLEAVLHRVQPQLPQARHLGPVEALFHQVRQRGPAPLRQRLAQQFGGGGGLPGRQLRPARRGLVVEARHVEPGGIDPEYVPRCPGDQFGRPRALRLVPGVVHRQGRTQSGDRVLHDLPGRHRTALVRPESPQQLTGGHHLVRTQQQQAEHGPLFEPP